MLGGTDLCVVVWGVSKVMYLLHYSVLFTLTVCFLIVGNFYNYLFLLVLNYYFFKFLK